MDSSSQISPYPIVANAFLINISKATQINKAIQTLEAGIFQFEVMITD
jgi:hypothetical protein